MMKSGEEMMMIDEVTEAVEDGREARAVASGAPKG